MIQSLNYSRFEHSEFNESLKTDESLPEDKIYKEIFVSSAVSIIDSKKYRIAPKIQEQAASILFEAFGSSGANAGRECFNKENKDLNALLAMKDGRVVGVLLSNGRKVDYLAVASGSRSTEEKRTEDKIGTRLMLKAMKKAKQLGHIYLTLEYSPPSKDASCIGQYKLNCDRRDAFYFIFEKKFGIPSKYRDSVWQDDDDGTYDVTRLMMYDLRHFNYRHILENIFLPIVLPLTGPEEILMPNTESRPRSDSIVIDDALEGLSEASDID